MTIDTILFFNANVESYARALAASWKNRQATCCRLPEPGANLIFGEHVLLAGVIGPGRTDARMEAHFADLIAERAGSAIVIALPGATAPHRIIEADIPVIETPGDPASDGDFLDLALRELDRLAIFSAGLKWRRISPSRLRTPKEVDEALATVREERRRRDERREEEEFVRRDQELAAAPEHPSLWRDNAVALGVVVGALLGFGLLAALTWWVLLMVRNA